MPARAGGMVHVAFGDSLIVQIATSLSPAAHESGGGDCGATPASVPATVTIVAARPARTERYPRTLPLGVGS
ncbi:MAG: hypothetical protein ACKV2T_19290 [Kofleriaceae bacterium]